MRDTKSCEQPFLSLDFLLLHVGGFELSAVVQDHGTRDADQRVVPADQLIRTLPWTMNPTRSPGRALAVTRSTRFTSSRTGSNR
jgi:hypothetical protein